VVEDGSTWSWPVAAFAGRGHAAGRSSAAATAATRMPDLDLQRDAERASRSRWGRSGSEAASHALPRLRALVRARKRAEAQPDGSRPHPPRADGDEDGEEGCPRHRRSTQSATECGGGDEGGGVRHCYGLLGERGRREGLLCWEKAGGRAVDEITTNWELAICKRRMDEEGRRVVEDHRRVSSAPAGDRPAIGRVRSRLIPGANRILITPQ
jgi:hypothetical protein